MLTTESNEAQTRLLFPFRNIETKTNTNKSMEGSAYWTVIPHKCSQVNRRKVTLHSALDECPFKNPVDILRLIWQRDIVVADTSRVIEPYLKYFKIDKLPQFIPIVHKYFWTENLNCVVEVGKLKHDIAFLTLVRKCFLLAVLISIEASILPCVLY